MYVKQILCTMYISKVQVSDCTSWRSHRNLKLSAKLLSGFGSPGRLWDWEVTQHLQSMQVSFNYKPLHLACVWGKYRYVVIVNIHTVYIYIVRTKKSPIHECYCLFFCLPEHSINLNHLTTSDPKLYWIWNQIAKGGAPPPPEKNEVIKHGHGKLPLQLARGGRFWPCLTTLPSTSLSSHLPGESGDCLVHRLQKAAANSSISKKGAFPRPDTSRKISIEPENDAFGNTLFLFQGYILRFHINLSGCTCEKKNTWHVLCKRLGPHCQ